MWTGSRVVAVVPAMDEAPRIGRVIAGMPAWVDAIVVVDDASQDHTARVAASAGDLRVEVVRHDRNRGVGAAIATGYARAAEQTGHPRDVFVVMAGDGQMDPLDLPAVVDPVSRGEADYVKGDRFFSRETVRAMPLTRRLGGAAFSWMTSQAIGMRVRDSQCGYTALAREAWARVDFDGIWPGYGYPNDLLSQLTLQGLRITEVPVRAVYADEVSRLKPRHIPVVAALVARAWGRRIRATLNDGA